MIDETPVLDIKPYIPQYDYPGIAQLNIRENCDSSRMFMSTVSNPESDSHNENLNRLENLNERVMDGEENGHITNIMPTENSR